ncbi:transposase [Candidatus Saccharibacteria bacterium]|nr:transposase [Candidatus Saccharibacteria bacterium]MBI3338195.1 transposase [Candidatus Saccharibacteria bacterium]
MPSKNVQKPNVGESYYHVYARGASKQPIFLEPADYNHFISLFSRYLSLTPKQDRLGINYPHLQGRIELLAYCLMGNHFHLLLYQIEQGAMSQLMKSIMTSYGRYFNFKYKRSGSMYESTYKASLINSDAYLTHISRYIHLNPRYWQRYKYSSIANYLYEAQNEWLQNSRVMEQFSSSDEYRIFLEDYEGEKVVLDELKYELANL